MDHKKTSQEHDSNEPEDLQDIPDLPSFESLLEDASEQKKDSQAPKQTSQGEHPQAHEVSPSNLVEEEKSHSISDEAIDLINKKVAQLEAKMNRVEDELKKLTDENLVLKKQISDMSQAQKEKTTKTTEDVSSQSVKAPDVSKSPKNIPADPVDELENIPIDPQRKECKVFSQSLENLMVAIEQPIKDIEMRIDRSKGVDEKKKILASSYQSKNANLSFEIYEKQKKIIHAFTNSSQMMLSKLKDSSLTSSHILDFLEMGLNLKDKQKKLSIQQERISDKGPVEDLLQEAVMLGKILMRDLNIIDLTDIN